MSKRNTITVAGDQRDFTWSYSQIFQWSSFFTV